jgi:hypothetical protein
MKMASQGEATPQIILRFVQYAMEPKVGFEPTTC